MYQHTVHKVSNVHIHTHIHRTMAAFDAFHKEFVAFQKSFVQDIQKKMTEQNLMTDEIQEFFTRDVLSNLILAKKSRKKAVDNPNKEKTARGKMVSETIAYIKQMYSEHSPSPQGVMAAAQHMITMMKNDPTMEKNDAMLRATTMVNEKKDTIIFPEITLDAIETPPSEEKPAQPVDDQVEAEPVEEEPAQPVDQVEEEPAQLEETEGVVEKKVKKSKKSKK